MRVMGFMCVSMFWSLICQCAGSIFDTKLIHKHRMSHSAIQEQYYACSEVPVKHRRIVGNGSARVYVVSLPELSSERWFKSDYRLLDMRAALKYACKGLYACVNVCPCVRVSVFVAFFPSVVSVAQ